MSRINIERLENEFLTTSQAAHVIGIPRQRVYELVKESRLRGAHVGRDVPGGRGVLLVDAASCETYRREMEELKGQ